MKGIALSLITLIALIASYFWLTYTDVTITQGQRYGFTIGQSKEDAFLAAKHKYQGSPFYFLNPLSDGSWGPHAKLTFSEGDYQAINVRNNWRLYFNDGDYSNVLILYFDDSGKLEKIYRHEQAFELP